MMMIIFTVPEESGKKVLKMDEYIRREDAIKCIECQCIDGKMWGNDESEGTLIEAYSAIDDLMEIPPADVAPVVHGRWEVRGQEVFCTNCDKESGYNAFGASAFSDYCPNCGAKMDLCDECEQDVES